MLTSEEVSTISQAFVDGLKRILGEKLHSAYIYGAAAFPDAVPTGDIDFHVILRSKLTDEERSDLERLHVDLADQFPPLGSELDGYYILLADAYRQMPPRSQMWRRAVDESWALHCEHIRAGRCVVLHGPEPTGIYPPASWPEIESALYGELDYVEENICEYPDYCILNLCRLIYSFETKNVVISKAQASNWAHDVLPQWRQHIDLARKSYARQATPEDRQFMLTEIDKFLEFAKARIEKIGKKESANNRMQRTRKKPRR